MADAPSDRTDGHRDHPDHVEDLQRADHRQEHPDPDRRAEQRDRDVPLDLPPARAVDRGGLGQLVRHVRQSGEEQDDGEADVLPGEDEQQRPDDHVEVGEPRLHQAAQPERPQQGVRRAVVHQDELPHDADGDLGEHVGHEDQQPEHGAPAEAAVEQQRDAERDRALDQQRPDDDDGVVAQRVEEDRVLEGEDGSCGTRRTRWAARRRATGRGCSRPRSPSAPARTSRRRRSPASVSPMISYHLRRVRAARVDERRTGRAPPTARARGRRGPRMVGGGHFWAADFMVVDDLLRACRCRRRWRRSRRSSRCRRCCRTRCPARAARSVASVVAFRIDFSAGSVTPASAPLATGRPTPVSAYAFCTSGLTMYLRNSTHSAGAFLAQANPSPPPRAAFGSPAAPVIAGTGNQPRYVAEALAGRR